MNASVPYSDVVDFVARWRCRQIELRLYTDGDHRLTDRKDDPWWEWRIGLIGWGNLEFRHHVSLRQSPSPHLAIRAACEGLEAVDAFCRND